MRHSETRCVRIRCQRHQRSVRTEALVLHSVVGDGRNRWSLCALGMQQSALRASADRLALSLYSSEGPRASLRGRYERYEPYGSSEILHHMYA